MMMDLLPIELLESELGTEQQTLEPWAAPAQYPWQDPARGYETLGAKDEDEDDEDIYFDDDDEDDDFDDVEDPDFLDDEEDDLEEESEEDEEL